ncbi:MAG: hypothetical protein CTY30_07495 [Methylocystis sp.]|nr:MAG: hypothetical protein CTY30_07495 [Methylocystis sp.]
MLAIESRADRAVGHALLKWASSHGWSTSKRQRQASPLFHCGLQASFSLEDLIWGIVGQFGAF